MHTISVGTFTTTPRMREYVNAALDANRLSYGDFSQRFEREFAALHDSSFAVWSNSGTSSLQVALQALKETRGWQDGDEVIVPAVTFVASVNVILHNRLTPVLVDVDPLYYEIDAEKVIDAITPSTRALMPVHLFGQPCDMTTLGDIADAYDLAMVEDSCECMFARHNGRAVGSFGDVGCFSTYVAHLITTGVGGLSITNDVALAVKMRSLVNHGRDGIYISIDDDDSLSDAKRNEIIARRFKFDSIGHSYRITELEAALGVAQLETYKEMIWARQTNALYLTRRLDDLQDRLQLPRVRPNTTHSWMMYPIVLRSEPKACLCEYLEAHGIETREMLPLVSQPCYAGRWNPEYYPVARWIDRNGFYVGCHQELTVEDLDYVAETIREYFAQ